MIKKLLYVQWNSFMNKGVLRALKELNVTVSILDYIFTDWEKDDNFCSIIRKEIEKDSFDAVFSINYSPLISEVAKDKGLRYIFWVYDCPIHIRDISSLRNEVNEGYFFDAGQVNEYRQMGINAYYLPLAADGRDFGFGTFSLPAGYNTDISLIGKLYKTDYDYYTGPLDDYLRGRLEGMLAAQLKLYGAYILPELIDESFVDKLNFCYKAASNGKASIEKRELIYMLASEVTSRERYLILSMLSKHWRVDLYSPKNDDRLSNIKFCGYADYYSKMPEVFNSSRINLNITLKAISSGVPLRVFDVLACGGFLISNYQSGMEELFKENEELVVYYSFEDLLEKADYYLKNDDERMRIAINGYNAVKERHTYINRLKEILN